MADLSLPLVTSFTPVFNALGVAQGQVGPAKPFETWKFTRYTVSASVPCSFTLYRNFISPSTVLDSTTAGQNDVGGIQCQLNPGEHVIGVWTNGLSGQNCACILEGIQVHRGRGL